MKKTLITLLALVLVLTTVLSAAAVAETWTVAINATFPPFESIKDGATDEYIGIDIDIAEYIGEKLGIEMQFADMQFSALVPTMQAGQADMIISGISPTAERKEVLDFTDSYYFPPNAIICAEGAGYDTLDKLVGKTIGVSMGTTYAQVAASVQDATVAELDSTPLVVQEILADRCDAGIFDATQAAEFVKQYAGTEMHIIESEVTLDDSFAIALPKGSEYVDDVNAILAEMTENGKMHEILAKHLGEDAATQYEAFAAGLAK